MVLITGLACLVRRGQPQVGLGGREKEEGGKGGREEWRDGERVCIEALHHSE